MGVTGTAHFFPELQHNEGIMRFDDTTDKVLVEYHDFTLEILCLYLFCDICDHV